MGQFVPQIEALSKLQLREVAPFRVGDSVRVHYRITEGDKERVQVFQGTVIRKSGGGIGRTFCVRKRSGGVGVERVFPYHSPRIEKLEVVSHGRVRRSRHCRSRISWKAGSAMAIRAAARSSTDLPRRSATPCSVTI